MKVLLDSHTLLWMVGEPTKLSGKARKILEEPDTEICLSVGTAWELVIKESLKKITSPTRILTIISRAEIEYGLFRLNISDRHLGQLAKLPFHHRDPFDRILVAQSLAEKIPLVSSDEVLDKYKIKRIW